ncbi:Cuticle protein 16.8-like protein [Dinothrombium tinctorium]|uniref:Cuticle protein 16.8-like protein n=1 Tax=Dinothrombium tinctorium TaxID=1965070 RepID=A0A3S3P9Q3_9ACAR|nr:Cuticle protein 16.8-like protein [Dinothrombium tinctorium]
MPYSFGYEVRDPYGNEQYRKELSNGQRVTGSYGYYGPDGLYRHVDYIADEFGFRANIRTNEPGVKNENPASVRINSRPYIYPSPPPPPPGPPFSSPPSGRFLPPVTEPGDFPRPPTRNDGFGQRNGFGRREPIDRDRGVGRPPIRDIKPSTRPPIDGRNGAYGKDQNDRGIDRRPGDREGDQKDYDRRVGGYDRRPIDAGRPVRPPGPPGQTPPDDRRPYDRGGFSTGRDDRRPSESGRGFDQAGREVQTQRPVTINGDSREKDDERGIAGDRGVTQRPLTDIDDSREKDKFYPSKEQDQKKDGFGQRKRPIFDEERKSPREKYPPSRVDYERERFDPSRVGITPQKPSRGEVESGKEEPSRGTKGTKGVYGVKTAKPTVTVYISDGPLFMKTDIPPLPKPQTETDISKKGPIDLPKLPPGKGESPSVYEKPVPSPSPTPTTRQKPNEEEKRKVSGPPSTKGQSFPPSSSIPTSPDFKPSPFGPNDQQISNLKFDDENDQNAKLKRYSEAAFISHNPSQSGEPKKEYKVYSTLPVSYQYSQIIHLLNGVPHEQNVFREVPPRNRYDADLSGSSVKESDQEIEREMEGDNSKSSPMLLPLQVPTSTLESFVSSPAPTVTTITKNNSTLDKAFEKKEMKKSGASENKKFDWTSYYHSDVEHVYGSNNKKNL